MDEGLQALGIEVMLVPRDTCRHEHMGQQRSEDRDIVEGHPAGAGQRCIGAYCPPYPFNLGE